MKIVVTGTAGFIGYHLTNQLLKDGHSIVGIDVINDYYDVQLKYDRLYELGINSTMIEANKPVKSTIYPNFSFLHLDLSQADCFSNPYLADEFDTIIHLAAQAGVRYSITNPKAYIDNNIVAFANLLEFARSKSIKHLIFASSSSVYGNNNTVPYHEGADTDHPVSLYAATKKSNELMAHTYSYLYGIPITGLRFFTVYGPWGRPDMSPILFANAIANNNPIKVFNEGKLSRDFTYVGDIVKGISQLLYQEPPKGEKGAGGYNPIPYRIYNIGNNQPVSLLYFIETMEKVMGKVAEKEWLPMQPGDVFETFADIDALHNLTGYTPETSIEEGLEKFAAWYKVYYQEKK